MFSPQSAKHARPPKHTNRHKHARRELESMAKQSIHRQQAVSHSFFLKKDFQTISSSNLLRQPSYRGIYIYTYTTAPKTTSTWLHRRNCPTGAIAYPVVCAIFSRMIPYVRLLSRCASLTGTGKTKQTVTTHHRKGSKKKQRVARTSRPRQPCIYGTRRGGVLVVQVS